ncbi:MAG: hypothetical protein ACRDQB_09335 [Thermocrispum sp.]
MAAIDALLRELHRVRAAIYDLRFSERYFEVRRHAYRREAVRRRERRAQLPCLFGTCGRVHPTGDDGSGRLSAP